MEIMCGNEIKMVFRSLENFPTKMSEIKSMV